VPGCSSCGEVSPFTTECQSFATHERAARALESPISRHPSLRRPARPSFTACRAAAAGLEVMERRRTMADHHRIRRPAEATRRAGGRRSCGPPRRALAPDHMNRRSPGPPAECAATANPDDIEPHRPQGDDELPAFRAREPRHEARRTRWMPTNSRDDSAGPSTSKQSSHPNRVRSPR